MTQAAADSDDCVDRCRGGRALCEGDRRLGRLATLTAPGTGVLSLERARIGGTFWPSALYEAVAQVAGVIAVSGLSFTRPEAR